MSALWAVIPAAGRGRRSARRVPKQFCELHGRRLLDWSVGALFGAVELRACVIALPEEYVSGNGLADNSLAGDKRSGNSRGGSQGDLQGGSRGDSHGDSHGDSQGDSQDYLQGYLQGYSQGYSQGEARDIRYCAGGKTRADSVAAGLNALDAAPGDWVLVHDAARPCVPREDIQRLVAGVREARVGGLLAQPLADTLKRGDCAGRVQSTLDRSFLWRAQTPQMFPVEALRRALARALGDGVRVTDEAAAMERAGHPVQLIEGSAANLKVTYPEDFALAEFWLRRQGRMAGAAGAPTAAP